jgi:hypothetical protein
MFSKLDLCARDVGSEEPKKISILFSQDHKPYVVNTPKIKLNQIIYAVNLSFSLNSKSQNGKSVPVGLLLIV